MKNKIKKWLFGEGIETKSGYFTYKNKPVITVSTSSGICYGWVEQKNVNMLEGDVLTEAYVFNYSTILIKYLERKGLKFIEIVNY